MSGSVVCLPFNMARYIRGRGIYVCCTYVIDLVFDPVGGLVIIECAALTLRSRLYNCGCFYPVISYGQLVVVIISFNLLNGLYN